MPTIISVATLIAQVKDEAEVATADPSYNDMLLVAANEALYEATMVAKNRADFRLHLEVPYSANPISLGNVYIHSVEKVTYTANNFPWELTEEDGILCPAPIEGKPKGYRLFGTFNALSPENEMFIRLVPTTSSVGGDIVTIDGEGFKQLIASNDLIYQLVAIPYLKAKLLQRLQMKRNVKPEKLQAYAMNAAQAYQALQGIKEVEAAPQ